MQGLAHTGGKTRPRGQAPHYFSLAWGEPARVHVHGCMCGQLPVARPEHSSPRPFFLLGAHSLVATDRAGPAALCCLPRLPKALGHERLGGLLGGRLNIQTPS